MTEKEVHEFAKQADLCWTNGQPMIEIHLLERFAALVAAHEREMCAQMCDVLAWNAEYGSEEIKIAALAIRERGEK